MYGESSSVGRASGCGSEGHGFDPHLSPQSLPAMGYDWLRRFVRSNKNFNSTMRRLSAEACRAGRPG